MTKYIYHVYAEGYRSLYHDQQEAFDGVLEVKSRILTVDDYALAKQGLKDKYGFISLTIKSLSFLHSVED